jgi:RNA polymerase sigma factor (sigma-70 family)
MKTNRTLVFANSHTTGSHIVTPDITASQIVALLKVGNTQAYKKLYDSYGRSILLLILRIVKLKIVAEDLTQDTFVKIFKTLHQYESSKGSLRYWVLTIARNTAIDYLRSKRHINSARHAPLEVVKRELEVKYQTQINIDVIGIQQLLSVLTLQHGLILQLCYLQGFTHMEAAKQLGIPIGTVKSRIRRSMKLLRKCFRENNYSSGISL